MKSQINELKAFLGGCSASDEVIALALKKSNMQLEAAINMVITEDDIADLQAELDKEKEVEQENNLMIIAAEQEKKEGEEEQADDKLNLIISNKAEYFDLLFDLLNLGIPDVTSSVWSLLMQIPVN